MIEQWEIVVIHDLDRQCLSISMIARPVDAGRKMICEGTGRPKQESHWSE